jgi:tRNA (guanine-N7-)-methyltransferase
MGKDKLRRFAENLTFPNLFQPEAVTVLHDPHPMRGKWKEHFGNAHPITLELGCGKGEYTVGLARLYPERNFIGVDIKGARMWKGAKTAIDEGLNNVAFLRTRVDFITRFFAPGEVDQIWLTFSDPHIGNEKGQRRLSSPLFIERYRQFMLPGSLVHLKTDSTLLYEWTLETLPSVNCPVLVDSNDVYGDFFTTLDEEWKAVMSIRTFYEQRWLKEGLKIKYLRWQV